MRHVLLDLSRGRVQTTRKYHHGELRCVPLSEWIALALNNRIPLLKTANDIKAFTFILSLTAIVTTLIYILRQL